MKLSPEDEKLLSEMCMHHEVSFEKVVRLLQTVRAHEFKERRTGIYDALRDIIKTDFSE